MTSLVGEAVIDALQRAAVFVSGSKERKGNGAAIIERENVVC